MQQGWRLRRTSCTFLPSILCVVTVRGKSAARGSMPSSSLGPQPDGKIA